MRPRRPHSHDVGKVNVTPLIDVVMCLIVFYLLVGKLASDRLAKLDLPASGVGAQPPADAERTRPLVINIAPRSEASFEITRVVVQGREVGPDELRTLVFDHAANRAQGAGAVQIRADRRLPYAAVAGVVELCREAGLASIKLTTTRVGAPAAPPATPSTTPPGVSP